MGKKAKPKRKVAKRRTGTDAVLPFAPMPVSSEPAVSNASLHNLFQVQTMEMLDRSDLSEEQKQSILVAMNCPCCGAGVMNYTAPLNRKKKPGPVI